MSDPKKVVEISEQGQRTTNLAAPKPAAGEGSSPLQRAFSALRTAVPFAQRLLPLLDGNIVTAVSNILAPHPPKPAPPIDLLPVENGLADLETRQRDLSAELLEQNTALKRVEDRLERLHEATSRNSIEQQELKEGLKKLGARMNVIALIALVLLAMSVLLNLVLFLHFAHLLP